MENEPREEVPRQGGARQGVEDDGRDETSTVSPVIGARSRVRARPTRYPRPPIRRTGRTLWTKAAPTPAIRDTAGCPCGRGLRLVHRELEPVPAEDRVGRHAVRREVRRLEVAARDALGELDARPSRRGGPTARAPRPGPTSPPFSLPSFVFTCVVAGTVCRRCTPTTPVSSRSAAGSVSRSQRSTASSRPDAGRARSVRSAPPWPRPVVSTVSAAEAHGVPEVRKDALRPLGRKVEPQDVRRAPDRLRAVGLVDVEVLAGPGGSVVAPAAPEPRDADALRDVLAVVPADHLEVALGSHRVPDDQDALSDQRHLGSPRSGSMLIWS